MESQFRNSTKNAFLPLLAALLGITMNLSADPVWQLAPQKKDVLPNPKGSISCIEKADRYQVSLEFPGRDLSKVLVNLKDGVLHIEAPAEGSLPQVSRDIPMEGSSRDGSLSIDRSASRGLLLVTVPKEGSPSTGRAASRRALIPAIIPVMAEPSDSFADDEFAMMFSQMRRMERAMASMMAGFPDVTEPPIGSGQPVRGAISRSGMPLLEDAGDHYVVRVSLPGQDLSKVNVNLKDGMLTIEASREASEKPSGNSYVASSYQYSQAMNLPGPVVVGKMKVDRQGDELVVTLPKLRS